MALASNTRFQLAQRFQADLQIREPLFTIDLSIRASGDPLLTIKNSSGTVVAVSQVRRRSFSGFNVVAELSNSAAEGLPEHVIDMLQLNSNSQLLTSMLSLTAYSMGASSINLGFKAAPAESDLDTASNFSQEIVNSARYGAAGQ